MGDVVVAGAVEVELVVAGAVEVVTSGAVVDQDKTAHMDMLK